LLDSASLPLVLQAYIYALLSGTIHFILKMEAAKFSETFVSYSNTTDIDAKEKISMIT
jgi:hypothetical protein